MAIEVWRMTPHRRILFERGVRWTRQVSRSLAEPGVNQGSRRSAALLSPWMSSGIWILQEGSMNPLEVTARMTVRPGQKGGLRRASALVHMV